MDINLLSYSAFGFTEVLIRYFLHTPYSVLRTGYVLVDARRVSDVDGGGIGADRYTRTGASDSSSA
jgi:hypothetical protein